MTEKKYKEWYRFIDKNCVYDYKSIYNAIEWARKKVRISTSYEIRIFRVRKLSRGLELECVGFTKLNRSGSVTTAWRDIDIYRDYKEKELRVRQEEKVYKSEGASAGNGDCLAA